MERERLFDRLRARTSGRLANAASASPYVAVLPLAVYIVMAYRRRWMDDDGFINLRIVRNVLVGNGPVYNLGERVETATSPLWLWILVAAGKCGFNLERAAVFGGITCAGVGLGLAILGALRTTLRDRKNADDGQTELTLPYGALLVAVLPVAWDYASAGLEMGLVFLWLGASYSALTSILCTEEDGASVSPRTRARAAILFGIGTLIRPELALYSAAFFAPLTVRRAPANGSKSWTRWVNWTNGSLAICAIALPLAYQIFRMGYYAALTPNTAIAKEAFGANWSQGLCYARNFFFPYLLPWPLAILGVLLVSRLADLRRARRLPLFALSLFLPLAAIVHALYIERVGGDYMHGRMFLPVIFAGMMPIAVATVVVRESRTRRSLRPFVVLALSIPFLVWVVRCGGWLRVSAENQCGIGDERGWYAKSAQRTNPVLLADYQRHDFYTGAKKDLEELADICADVDTSKERCRAVDIHESKRGILLPRASLYRVSEAIDPRVTGVVDFSAIGIAGYIAKPEVQVSDRIGLADPWAARLVLESRGRPGHEKTLPNSWMLARYAEPRTDDDVATKAARRAMKCGALHDLDQAVHAPLTARLFWTNVRLAGSLQALRIPLDPFAAEAELCHTPLVPAPVTGSATGGETFRWECPPGSGLTGLRVGYAPDKKALSRVIAICHASGAGASETVSPPVGEEKNGVALLRCVAGERVVGLEGRSSDLVRQAKIICASRASGDVDPNGANHASIGSTTEGSPYALACPVGTFATGIVGRAGDQLDALGLVCGGTSAP